MKKILFLFATILSATELTISKENADGITIFYNYTPTGLLESVTSCDGEFFQNFTYDANGNLLEANDNGHTISLEKIDNILIENFDKRFTLISTYDEQNRPLLVKFPDHSTLTFSYDNNISAQYTDHNGNTQTLFPSTEDISYPPDITDEIPDISYDAKGNITEGNFWYDTLNRLIETPETTYTYDAFNRRLSKSTWTDHEFYLYIGDQEIAAVNLEGKVKEITLFNRKMRYDAEIDLYFTGKRYYSPKYNRWLTKE
jgi:hypothetical protein